MLDNNLFEIMDDKGFSCKELADKLSSFGIREETVFQWADGRRVPPARVKKAIAKILGCKVSDIF